MRRARVQPPQRQRRDLRPDRRAGRRGRPRDLPAADRERRPRGPDRQLSPGVRRARLRPDARSRCSGSAKRAGRHPRATLLAQDAIYVGGGSMVNLLAIWRAHGLDEILEECWRQGILICGQSAGAMCWFEQGVTCSSGAPAAASGWAAPGQRLRPLPGRSPSGARSSCAPWPRGRCAPGLGARGPDGRPVRGHASWSRPSARATAPSVWRVERRRRERRGATASPSSRGRSRTRVRRSTPPRRDHRAAPDACGPRAGSRARRRIGRLD